VERQQEDLDVLSAAQRPRRGEPHTGPRRLAHITWQAFHSQLLFPPQRAGEAHALPSHKVPAGAASRFRDGAQAGYNFYHPQQQQQQEATSSSNSRTRTRRSSSRSSSRRNSRRSSSSSLRSSSLRSCALASYVTSPTARRCAQDHLGLSRADPSDDVVHCSRTTGTPTPSQHWTMTASGANVRLSMTKCRLEFCRCVSCNSELCEDQLSAQIGAQHSSAALALAYSTPPRLWPRPVTRERETRTSMSSCSRSSESGRCCSQVSLSSGGAVRRTALLRSFGRRPALAAYVDTDSSHSLSDSCQVFGIRRGQAVASPSRSRAQPRLGTSSLTCARPAWVELGSLRVGRGDRDRER
jgi:hypothetical protein